MDAGFALLAVLALVLANGFFVAAEFSLVTVRKTRIDQLIAEGSRLAKPVRRALNNPTAFIAATQVGITMASLGLGWVGEPAIAAIILPAFPPRPHCLAPRDAGAGGARGAYEREGGDRGGGGRQPGLPVLRRGGGGGLGVGAGRAPSGRPGPPPTNFQGGPLGGKRPPRAGREE